jgi:geranylgeranyl diphosphate synthase type II
MNSLEWYFPPQLVEDALQKLLPESALDSAPELARLRLAMRSALFNGGKRLRSQLVTESYAVVSRAANQQPAASGILPMACALELIHAYSLVHDDLPSMDNADTRRGRPSCHREWGEATAILVGDALQTLAFEIVGGGPWLAQSTLRALCVLARATGEGGMVGGQTIDIDWSNEHITQVEGAALLQMHALKTGALIRASCEVGAILAGGNETQIAALAEYGAQLGRAFQIQDDVLDVEGDPQLMGKGATDAENFKITAPGIFGLQTAKQMARDSESAALAALETFGDEASALRELARAMTERKK